MAAAPKWEKLAATVLRKADGELDAKLLRKRCVKRAAKKQAAADLSQVVRGQARRHADRDAVRAVAEQVRELGGQDHRFLFLAIIGVAEIHGIFVDIAQQHR